MLIKYLNDKFEKLLKITFCKHYSSLDLSTKADKFYYIFFFRKMNSFTFFLYSWFIAIKLSKKYIIKFCSEFRLFGKTRVLWVSGLKLLGTNQDCMQQALLLKSSFINSNFLLFLFQRGAKHSYELMWDWIWGLVCLYEIKGKQIILGNLVCYS